MARLHTLPAQHVDTGMGFERLCMVLQGKRSNYDTDVFQPLIQALAKRCGKVYGAEEKADIAMRVIADHLRAISLRHRGRPAAQQHRCGLCDPPHPAPRRALRLQLPRLQRALHARLGARACRNRWASSSPS
jgi:hypothetical protein